MLSATGTRLGSTAPSRTIARAQFGAVGEAEIIDLVLAQCRAHDVHVARRRRGPDVGEELRAHPLGTRIGELAVERFDVGDAFWAVVGHRLTAERIELSVGAATQLRRGMAD